MGNMYHLSDFALSQRLACNNAKLIKIHNPRCHYFNKIAFSAFYLCHQPPVFPHGIKANPHNSSIMSIFMNGKERSAVSNSILSGNLPGIRRHAKGIAPIPDESNASLFIFRKPLTDILFINVIFVQFYCFPVVIPIHKNMGMALSIHLSRPLKPFL